MRKALITVLLLGFLGTLVMFGSGQDVSVGFSSLRGFSTLPDTGPTLNADETITGAWTFSGATIFSGAVSLTDILTVTGESNLSSLVQGGSVLAIASTSKHFTAAQWCDNSIITHDLGILASTANAWTPTAAALIADCIPATGDFYRFTFRNISDADEVITLVASTSVDFQEPVIASGSDMLVLQGGQNASIEVFNLDGTNVLMNVIQFQVAD